MAGLQITPWPARDAPGRYRAVCSCRRWAAIGTAAEIDTAAARHDDSPFTRHVVRCAGRTDAG